MKTFLRILTMSLFFNVAISHTAFANKDAKELAAEENHQQYDRSTIFAALFSNFRRTLPLAFYVVLGAATQKELPKIGRLHWAIPASFFLANMYARIDASQTTVKDPEERAKYQDRVVADYLVFAGLSATTAVAMIYSTSALPVIGAFLFTDFIVAGDHSPVDHFKANVAYVLDYVRGVK